jgi:hypothetical protein
MNTKIVECFGWKNQSNVLKTKAPRISKFSG